MKKLNELDLRPQQNKLPEKPSEESTREWLAGMDECYQQFIKLYNEGNFGDLVIDFDNMTVNGKDIMKGL